MSSVLAAITWDLDPVIFELGKLQIRYYGLLWGIGIWAAYVICKKLFLNEKEDPKLIDPLLFSCIIGGILGSRLGHVIFYQIELFQQDFFSVFLPIKFYQFDPEFPNDLSKRIFSPEFSGFSGLASHGGAVGLILALIWYKYKKSSHSFLWIFDKVAYPIAITAFFIRIANFMNSEIIGDPTNSNYGVIFSQIDSEPRHPAQLYEAFAYLLIFFLLKRMYWKGKAYLQEGKLIGTLFVTMFTARFLIEFTKNSQGGIGKSDLLNSIGLETGQWLSIPFIIIGGLLLYRLKKQPKLS
ncbi:MAG: prolipoprotein diacylglyceryl transferase [Flavobacteriales bacterium]|nr:prolipoprotein diacylglyceryl transferase [Flavobacteriales bacterium]MBI35769.1 prolipoprotein diacylglyceryl transferase [Flavobacteriales bacterium]|tara:strand:+ start:27 stop:914 length:888 start_codon:yes stop_codon:yes gene_type:complete